MSTPKERHYWSQLRSALTAGQWETPFPAKTPNGTTLSWPELFRKFNKHCRGYGDVAEVGRQVQALALLIDSRESVDAASVEQTGVGEERKRGWLALDGVCMVPEEHKEEAKAGYDILQSLQSSKFDQLNLTLSYHAYALGDPALCIAHLEGVPALLQFQNHIPTSGSTKSSTNQGQGLLVHSVSYAPSTTSFSGSFSTVADVTPLEIRDGRAWAMTETLRSVCLKGMALELLHPSEPHLALEAYRSVLPLFASLQSELGLNVVPPLSSRPTTTGSSSTTTSPSPSRPVSQHHHYPYLSSSIVPQIPTLAQAEGKPDPSLFAPLKELWRWVERLLWRAVVLTARVCDIRVDEDPIATSTDFQAGPSAQETSCVSLWTYLAYYMASSAYWPPSFRSVHRTTVGMIHLRGFVLRYGPAGGTFTSPLLSTDALTITNSKTTKLLASTNTSASTFSALRRPPWIAEALSVVRTQRTILTASTKFPPAGERNVRVEEFAEVVVRVWEVWVGWSIGFGFTDGSARVKGKGSDPEGVDPTWVIEILTWSQTLTFHSSLVLRHLMRLLYLSSSFSQEADANKSLAKRTLQLYIQVVSKAYEASKEGIGEDMDSDTAWVETLVFGARMLCAGVGEQGRADERGQTDGGEALADLKEAHIVLEKARTRLDPEDCRLVAEVLLAEGVVWSLCGSLGQDPLTRPAHLRKAHECLVRSIQANATPSTYYHLALSFARQIPASPGVSVSSHSINPKISSNTPSSPNPAPDTTPGAIDPYVHTHSLKQALQCAGQAVEGAPRDVRCWHLLGLLLSAKEEWSGAKEVLERGATLDPTGPDEDEDETRDEGIKRDAGDSSASDEDNSEEADTVMQSTLTLQVPNGSPSARVADYAPSAKSKLSSRKFNGVSTGGISSGNGNSSPKGYAPHRGFASSSQPLLALPADAVYLPSATNLPVSYSSPALISTTSDSIEAPTTKQYAITYDEYPPTSKQLFERHLQLRMSQMALSEIVDGPEGAEEGWLQVFAWVAEKNREREKGGVVTPATGTTTATNAPTLPPSSLSHPHLLRKPSKTRLYHMLTGSANVEEAAGARDINGVSAERDAVPSSPDSLAVPFSIGITISPATPELEAKRVDGGEREEESIIKISSSGERSIDAMVSGGVERDNAREAEKERDRELGTSRGHDKEYFPDQDKKTSSESKHKRRSSSIDRERTAGVDASKSKKEKVQQMLKDRVHKGRAGLTAVSRKIGHGVARNGGLRRSNSTPDFHAVLHPTSYQASSIHSRRRLSSLIHSGDRTPTDSPTPPPLPSHDFASISTHTDNTTNTAVSNSNPGSRTPPCPREKRLMSDLWLMSAATFRRLGKIEQAKGSIQEAEVRDEANPSVWVQLGLYYISLRSYQHAVDTLQKAHFISPDDVAATVHLSRLYLDPEVTARFHSSSSLSSNTHQRTASSGASLSAAGANADNARSTSSPDVDLAAGMLGHLTKGRGWDVPEAWYYLARAYGMQGRKERERETLKIALEFAEGRGVRALGDALGWCL